MRERFNTADDWIATHITETDIAVTADIPLAARCLKKGAKVLDPKGRVYSEDSIGDALANRDLMAFLRDTGTITGGPPPFEPKDRSLFLQRLGRAHSFTHAGGNNLASGYRSLSELISTANYNQEIALDSPNLMDYKYMKTVSILQHSYELSDTGGEQTKLNT